MLTTRQQEIWQFLAEYVDAHGYPPTVREIGDAVGLASPSTVHAHLANLERAGLLKPRPDASRVRSSSSAGVARRPRRESRRCRHCHSSEGSPPVGRCSPNEDVEERIAVPEPLGRNADFLLRVKGDSMIEAGILDGDIVVVRKQSDARARRDRGRARRRRRVRRRGDREDVPPRARRPDSPPARERRARAALPRARRDPRQGDGVFRSLR